ncbi:MAG: anthranilate synthase component I family protein [Bacteroidales bacterium]
MKYTFRTITQKMLADLQTPVGIYLKVRDVFSESVLLESSDFHGAENGFSFIGIGPLARFQVQNEQVLQHFPGGAEVSFPLTEQDRLMDIFQDYLDCFEQVSSTNETRINGFFGYTSYNTIRYFESVETGKTPTSASEIPEMIYIFYKYIIVIDHFRDELTIIENLFGEEEESLNQIRSLLENRDFASYDFSLKGTERSSITDADYMDMVEKGIRHCLRGDVFQIVLSRCFMQDFCGDDFKVYRALRSINPSPYLFYFDFGSFRIFGSSPETHCKINGNRVYIDPIAGTFRRTGDDVKDKEQAELLLKDPKENAEHVMLVDLARNDLSRNASAVKLDFFKEVQYYSHVIHLVSRVEGLLPTGVNHMKVFADTFPAGTLSGAPKVRAMQLISQIEPYDRGAYGGCIGYVGLNGDLNQAIIIRSFVSKGNTLFYQAGAGIVSKSHPATELQEVNNKLGALKRAIDMASTLIN